MLSLVTILMPSLIKSKGNTTNLLATESTGALSRTVIQLLHALAKSTLTPEGHDSTASFLLSPPCCCRVFR